MKTTNLPGAGVLILIAIMAGACDGRAEDSRRAQAWVAECQPPLPSVAKIEGIRVDSACILVEEAVEAIRRGDVSAGVDSASLPCVEDATIRATSLAPALAREMGYLSSTIWIVRLRCPSKEYDLEAWLDPLGPHARVQWAHRFPRE